MWFDMIPNNDNYHSCGDLETLLVLVAFHLFVQIFVVPLHFFTMKKPKAWFLVEHYGKQRLGGPLGSKTCKGASTEKEEDSAC